MDTDKNRKRANELRWTGFQSVLTGVVIIFGVGCIFSIFLDEGTGSQSGSYSARRGLGLLLLGGVWGLWMIVRGVIYLIRAQSGDEHYAKGVEEAMDRLESKQAEMMRSKMGSGSWRNVFILLGWVFLFLVVIALLGILFGSFSSFSRYEGVKLIHP